MARPDSSAVSVLPWPRQLDVGGGSLQLLSSRFETSYEQTSSPRINSAVERFATEVAQLTGLPQVTEDAGVTLRISCEAAGADYPALDEDESYWLVVDDAGIYIDAACDRGVLHGLTTLTQIVSTAGVIPYVAIDDAPRFAWRGLLLDVARHFLDTQALSRTLQGMALCKLNVLHLHLSDDQGFRFPCTSYPKLASATTYSAADLSALVEEAAFFGIRVVPEIDMPGHVSSWLAAYPQWGSQASGESRRFGPHEACLDPTNEDVYTAIGCLFDELADIFPDECLHLGGDEVNPKWWSEAPAIAEFMDANQIADVVGLQAYFNQRVGDLLAARGKTVVAWDEVLQPSLNPDWIVQCWRGATTRDRARANGNRTLVSAHYYLDLNYPVDVHYGFDPLASQTDLVAREDALLDDPRFSHVAAGMRWASQWRQGAIQLASAANSGPVLGGEACLWGELVDSEVLDVRLWSRLPAVAERLWSPAECEDPDELHGRLEHYLTQLHPLRGFDLQARSRAQLHKAGVEDAWLPLIDMLEPVKWYGRLLGEVALQARISGERIPQARPYDADTPLTTIADYLAPESHLARQVDALCAALLDEPGAERAMTELEKLATGWISLHPAAAAPAPLAELAAACGELGRLVIERLQGVPAPQTKAQLAEITAPRGELMVAVGPLLHRWLTESDD
ncbi:MAG: family 20 glycosylhydrolase [Gammaproteobacteria bacterium]|nr:family 20 glycosylhydrolase [Gammaproteobacteria bacterium]